jgi:hypothetical protein
MVVWWRVVVGVAALTFVVGTPSATAELGYPVPTPQAAAIHSEFLIDPARPAPTQAAVCQVDSGVADWALSDFAPGQLTRYALDGGPVTDTDTLTPASPHGTLMASLMGAQVNGTRMVGIWPAVKIVSVRALVGGEQGFRYESYKAAIARCLQLKSTGVPVVAISLSLGGTTSPVALDVAYLENAVLGANARGVSVLAAAGNTPGEVLSPAREGGVIGVGAGGATVEPLTQAPVGTPCPNTAGLAPYSAAGLDVVGPGCRLRWTARDGSVWEGWGSSQAAAVTAVLVAAVRAYNPGLTMAGAERALVASSAANHGFIDAQLLFLDAGVDWRSLVKNRGVAVTPGETVPPGGVETAANGERRYAQPVLASRRRAGRVLRIRVSPGTRPRGASMYVRALSARRRILARKLNRPSNVVTLTLPRGAAFVDLRYRARAGNMRDSRPVRWAVSVQVGRRTGFPVNDPEFG